MIILNNSDDMWRIKNVILSGQLKLFDCVSMDPSVFQVTAEVYKVSFSALHAFGAVAPEDSLP